MRFLAIMMFIMCGIVIKYTNYDLTLDNLMSWLIYISFYHFKVLEFEFLGEL